MERLIEAGRIVASVDAVVEYLVNTKGLDQDTTEEIAREFAGTHTYLFRTRARKTGAETTT